MDAADRSTLFRGRELHDAGAQDKFSAPGLEGAAHGARRMHQKGKTAGLVECEVLDEKERLIARASSTCMTLRGPSAQGRQVTTDLIRNAKR